MDKYCLNLLCPRAAQERLADALLEREANLAFASQPALSHGLPTHRLTNIEQVMGRGDAVLFQVIADKTELHALLAQLGDSFAGSGLSYWAVQVAFEGEF